MPGSTPSVFAAPTKTEGGTAFPAAAYAYVPDPAAPSTWKLRLWETPSTKETAKQVGMAVAALGAGFRGNTVEIPSSALPAAKAKVRAAWKKANPDAKPDEMPAAIKGREFMQPTPSDVHLDGWDSAKHYLAKWKKKLMELVSARRSLTAEDVDGLMKWARSSTGGTARARLRARSAAAEQFAETPPNTLWVGYWLSADDAALLALPGGEAPESLHLTLAFCGDLDELPDDAGERAAAAISALSYARGPVGLDVTGVGRFEADDTGSGQDVLYATVEGEDEAFDSLRDDVCRALAAVGLPPRDDYGEYVPHVTLLYLEPDADAPSLVPPNLDLELDALTVAVAGARTAFPLRGAPSGPLSDGAFLAAVESALLKAGSEGGAVELADLARQGGGWRLFVDVPSGFADVPAWIPILPRPGAYTHPKYGEIRITRERNARFVANFDATVYQKHIPIDAEHETKVSGALGYIAALKQRPDGSVDARLDWTDRGVSLVESDRFKYVSPEWWDEWTDPATDRVHRDVLIGAALTTRPFFKEAALRPLVASERGLLASPPAAADGGDAGDDDDPAGGVPGSLLFARADAAAPEPSLEGDPMGDPVNPGAGAPSGGAGAAPTATQFAELQAERERQATELAALRQTVESATAALTQAAERVTALETERNRRRFTDLVLGRGDAGDGRRWFGEPDKHVGMLEALASKFGEESEQFTGYVELNRAHAEQLHSAGLFGERGRGGDGAPGGADAGAQLQAMAAKRATEKSISAVEAMAEIAAERPELYRQHAESTTVKV